MLLKSDRGGAGTAESSLNVDPVKFGGMGIHHQYLFICQVASARKQRNDLYVLRVRLPSTTCRTKVEEYR